MTHYPLKFINVKLWQRGFKFSSFDETHYNKSFQWLIISESSCDSLSELIINYSVMVSSWTFSSGVSIFITSGSTLSISGFGDSGFTVGVSDSLNSSIVADWPSVSSFIVSTMELGNPDEDEVVWVMLKNIITWLLRNGDFQLWFESQNSKSLLFEGPNDIYLSWCFRSISCIAAISIPETGEGSEDGTEAEASPSGLGFRPLE